MVGQNGLIGMRRSGVEKRNCDECVTIDSTGSGSRARDTSAWAEVQADVAALGTIDAGALANLPLWSRQVPRLATYDWSKLRAALPNGEDWDVWIDWYDERLRGGSRGEYYKLVFASVPQEEWDKGPAAANAWIKAQLTLRPAW